MIIPITFLLLYLWGIVGVCSATVFSEALTLFVVCSFTIIQQKRGKLPQKGLLLLPENDSESLCDITIRGSEQEAVSVSETLIECCIDNGIDGKNSNIIGIAAEEIAVNISRYGYKRMKRNYIDINLSMSDDRLILRIRDDGEPFDPTQYKPEEEGLFRLGGINMIKNTATKLSYIRVLNMNNTIIELDIKQTASGVKAAVLSE